MNARFGRGDHRRDCGDDCEGLRRHANEYSEDSNEVVLTCRFQVRGRYASLF